MDPRFGHRMALTEAWILLMLHQLTIGYDSSLGTVGAALAVFGLGVWSIEAALRPEMPRSRPLATKFLTSENDPRRLVFG